MEKLKSIKKTLKDSSKTYDVKVEEFIPYACHFDPHTLLTKNGELMQVIKLTGFAFESVENNNETPQTVREAIRVAVADSINSTNFCIYLHTFRRKTNLTDETPQPNGFCEQLDEAWTNYNDWGNKYNNELYLTIMIEGQGLDLSDFKTFFRCLWFKKELEFREDYLEQSCKELTNITNKILTKLDSYGARKLTIYKDDGIYYSQLTSFLGKIVNLKEEKIPLAAVDISEVLPSHKLSFGFNMLVSKGDTGKHFGAILTVKSYHEVSSKNVDDFLQVNQQFVITESFDFVNNKKALEDFKKQIFLHDISGDDFLSKASGLDDIINADKGSDTDYGEHQITIMIVEESVKLLNQSISELYDAITGLGIIVVREDIFLEDCYWAQLPGNFEFNKRMSPLNTNHLGGFASLYSFPAGRRENNHWGAAITVFNTVLHTPYFFNFHYNDNGHTFIIGPYGSGKTVLMNFLVSQAMKFNTRLFFFDHMRGGEIFIRSINGSYTRVSDNPSYGKAGFNPLGLDDTSENRQFLQKWFSYLLCSPYAELSDEDKKKIEDATHYNYDHLIHQDRRLSNIIPHFWPVEEGFQGIEPLEEHEMQKLRTDAAQTGDLDAFNNLTFSDLAKHISSEHILSQWYADGRYAYLFDNLIDELYFDDNHIFGVDLTDLVNDGAPLIPTIFYLMHRIEQSLDGYPTIIVLDEAWSLIDNYAFNDHIDQWLLALKDKNAMVIFATESVDGAEKSPMTKVLAKHIETKIFLPNKNSTPVGYEEVFGLSKAEYQMLNSMNNSDREFLLIHHVDAVVCKLDLSAMPDQLSVLSATSERLAVLESAMRDAGQDSNSWLPVFFERV